MKKSNRKKIYTFVLGSIFGISLSMLVGLQFFENIKANLSVQNQSIKLNVDELKNDLKESIKNNSKEQDQKDTQLNYSNFEEVLNILQDNYFNDDKIKPQKMLNNALRWFVQAIDDPHTTYLTSDENEDFQESLTWEDDFEWIGAEVSRQKDWIRIERPLDWQPAQKSWLKPLDIIVEIDWESTSDMSVGDAVDKIRGPQWTKVKLKIFRESENEVFEVEVVRDSINVPSVRSEILNLTGDLKVGHIDISMVWEETENALKENIEKLKENNIDWVILDLRWNWGGFLDIATQIASHFIAKWKEIVSTEYSNIPGQSIKSKWYWELENIPVVVLVDWLSASASEIISAALREQRNAQIIGTKTFGKGSIQTIKNLDDWSSLKYTIGKWFTPSWENVDQEGINPDIEVEFDPDLYEDQDIDNQLEKAKEIISKQINNQN